MTGNVHEEVREGVKSNDLVLLKYFFSDCLDGDPFYEHFTDDIAYCLENGKLFVPYEELHPMTLEHVDEAYWIQLKKDFMSNPSVERLEHMGKAAAILYRDRIQKIEETRKTAQQQVNTVASQESLDSIAFVTSTQERIPVSIPSESQTSQKETGSRFASEPIRRVNEPKQRVNEQEQHEDSVPKKVLGVGVLVVIVIAVIIIVSKMK